MIEAFKSGFGKGFVEGKTRSIITKKYFNEREKEALENFEKTLSDK